MFVLCLVVYFWLTFPNTEEHVVYFPKIKIDFLKFSRTKWTHTHTHTHTHSSQVCCGEPVGADMSVSQLSLVARFNDFSCLAALEWAQEFWLYLSIRQNYHQALNLESPAVAHISFLPLWLCLTLENKHFIL